MQIALLIIIVILTTLYWYGIFAMKNAENIQKRALDFVVNDCLPHHESLLGKNNRSIINLLPLALNAIARGFPLYK